MSFLGFLLSTPGCMLFLAAAIVLGSAAVRLTRCDCALPPVTIPPEPDTPALTAREQAFLASLAVRMADSDPRFARQLADHLRVRCPGVSDIDIMRCVVALGHVAKYFRRRELSDGDALAAYLHAMSGAVLELTELERSEIPR